MSAFSYAVNSYMERDPYICKILYIKCC